MKIPSIKNALLFLLKDRNQFLDSCLNNLGFLLSDKIYLTLKYRLKMHQWINWNNPRTFTEKIQWLKVNGFRPEYTNLVDKFAVKEFVAKKIGVQYVVPTIGVWESVDDIDWDSLPNQFVLKTTHGGGGCGVVLCKNIKQFDRDSACRKLRRSMKITDGAIFREHPYENVHKRIIAEELLTDYEDKECDEDCDLADYKFYCFNGTPKYCQVIRDRRKKETIDFYDMKWNHMPFVGLNPDASNGEISVKKPLLLDTMIDICKRLSEGMPFSRIDVYFVNNKIYFGEITLYPASGFGEFSPSEWNMKLGDLLILR
ncbi:MAG: hypothetical protein J6Y11_10615 [Paludibacteraceae bacterium]|nr:hypothetical protein [Paludibacteraceae bacterium]